MRKIIVLTTACLTFCFLLHDRSVVIATSAQDGPARKASRDDRELASAIRRLTDRSSDGLRIITDPTGGVSMDLDGRFQNVVLARAGGSGEPVAACVTSLGEANEFFGRDLESGEPIFSSRYARETLPLAARHGMSPQELAFYKKMIEDAIARRGENPESATITIVNNDGAGEGFNDPTVTTPEGGNSGLTRGQQRINLFNQAASIWGAFLDSSITTSIASQFNPLAPCTPAGGVLGAAGSATISRDFANAPFSGTWYHAALANKIRGSDSSGTPEINATFNSDVDNGCLGGGSRFYYGFDNSTPFNRINLLIVLLHEFGHGLGFQSFANGQTGTLNSGFPDIYTRFMFDRSTGKYWHEMTDGERQASALNTGNVLWDGQSVRIGSGSLIAGRDAATGRVQLFTPNPFQGGSSVSHFDSAVFPHVLMEPDINIGLPLNLDLTRQQMRDVGWYRDTNADLVPDTITSVVPAGGTIVIGTNVNIAWTNTGGFNRNVTIELSTDGGSTYPTTLATDIANTGSFSFTVPNTPTSQGRVRIREHNFVTPAGISAANFSISSTPPSGEAPFDFDGDGKTDISIFRPVPSEWWYQRSSNASIFAAQFGASSDVVAPGDFTGDGKADIALFRPASGQWFVLRSEDNSFFAFPWGVTGDIPAPADYDGDNKADAAVFRPSTVTWFVLRSTGGQTIVQFGAAGDKPVPADYDGDNKADIAIWRPNPGEWWRLNSSNGQVFAAGFGSSTDKAVPGDYTGDGKADIAFWRPSNGNWFILRSEDLSFFAFPWGASSDIPAPGDYDGDGKIDAAIFRPTETNWYVLRSTAGNLIQQFGLPTDTPVPSAFVR